MSVVSFVPSAKANVTDRGSIPTVKSCRLTQFFSICHDKIDTYDANRVPQQQPLYVMVAHITQQLGCSASAKTECKAAAPAWHLQLPPHFTKFISSLNRGPVQRHDVRLRLPGALGFFGPRHQRAAGGGGADGQRGLCGSRLDGRRPGSWTQGESDEPGQALPGRPGAPIVRPGPRSGPLQGNEPAPGKQDLPSEIPLLPRPQRTVTHSQLHSQGKYKNTTHTLHMNTQKLTHDRNNRDGDTMDMVCMKVKETLMRYLKVKRRKKREIWKRRDQRGNFQTQTEERIRSLIGRSSSAESLITPRDGPKENHQGTDLIPNWRDDEVTQTNTETHIHVARTKNLETDSNLMYSRPCFIACVVDDLKPCRFLQSHDP